MDFSGMGIAKCGKSNIMLKKQDFYDPHRRGVLSNNSEESFGISKVGKTVILCNKDDAADLNLKSNDFQKLISGEVVDAKMLCKGVKRP